MSPSTRIDLARDKSVIIKRDELYKRTDPSRVTKWWRQTAERERYNNGKDTLRDIRCKRSLATERNSPLVNVISRYSKQVSPDESSCHVTISRGELGLALISGTISGIYSENSVVAQNDTTNAIIIDDSTLVLPCNVNHLRIFERIGCIPLLALYNGL